MRFCFTPTKIIKRAFSLEESYFGESMTQLLEEALGKSNYDEHMVAQDPLVGGRTSGTVRGRFGESLIDFGRIEVIS